MTLFAAIREKNSATRLFGSRSDRAVQKEFLLS